jgi:hypothetical protein
MDQAAGHDGEREDAALGFRAGSGRERQGSFPIYFIFLKTYFKVISKAI